MPTWRDPQVAALREMMIAAAAAAPPDAPPPTWEERRAGFNAMGAAAPAPEGVRVESLELGGVPAEKLTPKCADATRTIFYLHGGGYCIGGCESHRGWVSRMADAAGATAYTIDYRLAPEHRFPAAVDDALAAWRAVLARGVDPSRTVIAGDSAGGGLSVATAVAARDAGLPLPAGLHLISPWANLTNASDAYQAKTETDFIITQAGIDDFKVTYLGPGGDAKAALASPVFADLSGLPPMLIQVGSEEVLMSDSTLLAERAGLALVDVTLRIWPDMVHIWPFFAQLGGAARATAESTAWIKARVP
ncbi:MAG TPA: alpha/beta hydrolase [Caulobacteraceae bacterium]|nr:alpha/beta hydrolase [Caulobacteraceae bacterium]